VGVVKGGDKMTFKERMQEVCTLIKFEVFNISGALWFIIGYITGVMVFSEAFQVSSIATRRLAFFMLISIGFAAVIFPIIVRGFIAYAIDMRNKNMKNKTLD